jgi:hypothetical protein
MTEEILKVEEEASAVEEKKFVSFVQIRTLLV